MTRWEPEVTDQVRDWYRDLGDPEAIRFEAAVEYLSAGGPNAGRPAVGEVITDLVPHLKELVIGRSIRVLFTFGPDRVPVLLFAGDKAGRWNAWYPGAIAEAARLYAEYLRDTGQS